jgi:hypothetical protein
MQIEEMLPGCHPAEQRRRPSATSRDGRRVNANACPGANPGGARRLTVTPSRDTGPMTSLRPPDPDFRVELANICEGAAVLFIEHTPLGSISEDASAPWLVDRSAWSSKLASVLPTDWLNEIATTYLAEAAHEIRAMSRLLADGATSASLDVLVRAVLERSGKVLWVLDPGVPLGSTRRVARAGLEISLSYAHYKSALRRLGAKPDVRSQVDSEARAHRNLLECWFTLDGPRLDRNDPSSPVVAEPAKWKLDGETLITYTAAAGLAAERAGLAASRGSATYRRSRRPLTSIGRVRPGSTVDRRRGHRAL